MSNLTTAERQHQNDVVRRLPDLPALQTHLSLVDRVSLRLSVWLLQRSLSRVEHRADRAQRAARVRLEQEREARERAYEREWLLRPTR
ncbi:MAG: hypothetical protein GX607_13775 [Myxococcales bacterium]|nr:hypothetical protein [Myxococcales bacterium]